MKILLVHNKYKYPGGEDTYVYSLMELLESKGHKVILYTKDNDSISSNFSSKFHTLTGLFFNPKVRSEIKTIIEKERPDVAHFNNIYPLISPDAYRVCKNMGIPVVQTIHNYRLICPGGFMYRNGKECVHSIKNGNIFKKIFSKCYRNSRIENALLFLSISYHLKRKSFDYIDCFIFPSFFTELLYKKHLPIAWKKTLVLPYFAPTQSGLVKKKSNFFLYVGRFSEEKGILDLLNVASQLSHIPFLFIGDGPLTSIISSYRKYGNIRILKHMSREKVYTYMRRAKTTIIPTKGFETGPIVAIEASLNHSPILAPRFGTFMELGKNLNITFYQPRNLQSLKEKILQLYRSKDNTGKTKAINYKMYLGIYHYAQLMTIYNS